jgi:selenium metabolism protein YedF
MLRFEEVDMPIEVDARGLPCPQPVILTRNAMREAATGDAITTLVTGADQVANVHRLAERAGWLVNSQPTEGGYAVHMVKGEAAAEEPELTPEEAACDTPQARSGTVLVLSSNTMGRGDDELGDILIRALVHTLTESDAPPETIILFNAGVKLAAEGSPLLDDLQTLQNQGIEILVCGTCLGYYELKEKLAVGVVSNMYDIAATMLSAAHTVTL